MTSADGPAVLQIYADGIATGHATFQERVPDWDSWQTAHLKAPRRVLIYNQEVVGWAALSPVSARPVYSGVAEVSLYVSGTRRGRGCGKALLLDLIANSEAGGLWTLQAGIFPENAASLALHRSCGFRIVGRRERLGRMTHGPLAGQWRDVILLERRSARP